MKYLEKYEKNFTQLDNNVIAELGKVKNYALEAIGLYTFMVSKPNDWDFSVDTIARQNNSTEAKVKKAMDILIEHKLVKRELYRASGKYDSIYCIFDSYTKAKEINFDLLITDLENQRLVKARRNNIYIYNNNNITNTKYKELTVTVNKESLVKKESLDVIESSKKVDFKEIDFSLPDFSRKKITKKDKYIQAIKDYRNFKANNPSLSISEALWAEWCENVIRVGGSKVTNSALVKQLKSSLEYPQDYLENKIEKALESGWLSPYFKKDDFQRYNRLKESNNKTYTQPRSDLEKKQETAEQGAKNISQYSSFGEIRMVDF